MELGLFAMWPLFALWLLFLGAAVYFGGKCFVLKRAARTLAEQLASREGEETNALLGVSTRDCDFLRLAAALNRTVRGVVEERHRLQRGDRALKSAVENVTHDLRTPLAAIVGYLELLRRETLPANARRYAEILSERADALSARVDELFRCTVTLSEETAEPVQLDLRDALTESLAAGYALLKARNIEPEILTPDGPVPCRADRAALARIFENLLANAVKYSPGDLSVTLAETGEVTFENSAPDLTPVQAARLFDRFYTVEDGAASTGLGLSIARALAERMGGELSARLAEGRLRVTLRLP